MEFLKELLTSDYQPLNNQGLIDFLIKIYFLIVQSLLQIYMEVCLTWLLIQKQGIRA